MWPGGRSHLALVQIGPRAALAQPCITVPRRRVSCVLVGFGFECADRGLRLAKKAALLQRNQPKKKPPPPRPLQCAARRLLGGTVPHRPQCMSLPPVACTPACQSTSRPPTQKNACRVAFLQARYGVTLVGRAMGSEFDIRPLRKGPAFGTGIDWPVVIERARFS